MIIRQTTTIVFEYPQDYLQEQEWCKTKDDRWIHKSTDTMCTVYENTISYSIGQPNSSEIPNNCEDEPQTETEVIRTIIHKMIDNTDLAEDVYPDIRQRLHNAVDEYEPQTERSE